jgi:hypothetical protein
MSSLRCEVSGEVLLIDHQRGVAAHHRRRTKVPICEKPVSVWFWRNHDQYTCEIGCEHLDSPATWGHALELIVPVRYTIDDGSGLPRFTRPRYAVSAHWAYRAAACEERMRCAGLRFQDTPTTVRGDNQTGVVKKTHGLGPKPARNSRRIDVGA